MAQESRPIHILNIDDNPDDQSAFKLYLEETGDAKITILHPQEVTIEDLLRAQIVLLDYELEYWTERDELDIVCLKPVDGLALASVLKRHLKENSEASPTAFAIYTGKIDKLADPLPPEYREYALASLNNLEWVFQKGSTEEGNDTYLQIFELAKAVSVLPKIWLSGNDGQPMRQLSELLAFDFDDEQLIEEVEACLPPIHELSQWSHGISVLRWFLHRILPYPCFLWDTYRLASRFRIDHKSLCENLKQDMPLYNALNECSYKGILPNFLGTRWWRSRIESFLWNVTDGNSSDISAVQQAIRGIAQNDLPDSSPSNYPIVCINTDYQPLNEFYAVEQAVRIQPDDYPAYADQAWTTIELAKEYPKLRALVIREDLKLLEIVSNVVETIL